MVSLKFLEVPDKMTHTHTHAYIEHKLIMWYETFNFNTPVPKEGQDILTMS